MTQSSNQLHEDPDILGEACIDRHRAIVSLMEELEAVDWYDQRVKATTDPELKAILEHNRDEEKEHAAMVIEWLRRHDKGFDRQLRRFLFSDERIAGGEGESSQRNSAPADAHGLGIGSLRQGG